MHKDVWNVLSVQLLHSLYFAVIYVTYGCSCIHAYDLLPVFLGTNTFLEYVRKARPLC